MSEEVTVSALVWRETDDCLQAGDPEKADYGYRIYQVTSGEHDGMFVLYFHHNRGDGLDGQVLDHSPTLEDRKAFADLHNNGLQTNDPNPLRGPETRGDYTITID